MTRTKRQIMTNTKPVQRIFAVWVLLTRVLCFGQFVKRPTNVKVCEGDLLHLNWVMDSETQAKTSSIFWYHDGYGNMDDFIARWDKGKGFQKVVHKVEKDEASVAGIKIRNVTAADRGRYRIDRGSVFGDSTDVDVFSEKDLTPAVKIDYQDIAFNNRSEISNSDSLPIVIATPYELSANITVLVHGETKLFCRKVELCWGKLSSLESEKEIRITMDYEMCRQLEYTIYLISSGASVSVKPYVHYIIISIVFGAIILVACTCVLWIWFKHRDENELNACQKWYIKHFGCYGKCVPDKKTDGKCTQKSDRDKKTDDESAKSLLDVSDNTIKINIAVTGKMDVGKSSFINTVSGNEAELDTGRKEERTFYPDQRLQNVMYWLLPELDDDMTCLREEYCHKNMMDTYDILIVIYAGSELDSNDIKSCKLAKCHEKHVPVYAVRNYRNADIQIKHNEEEIRQKMDNYFKNIENIVDCDFLIDVDDKTVLDFQKLTKMIEEVVDKNQNKTL